MSNEDDNHLDKETFENDIKIKKSLSTKLVEKYRNIVEQSIKKGYPKYNDTKSDGVEKFINIQKNKETDNKFLKDEFKEYKIEDDFLSNYYYPTLTRAENKLLELDSKLIGNDKKSKIKNFRDYLFIEKYFCFNKQDVKAILNANFTLLESIFIVKEYKEALSVESKNKLQTLKYVTNIYGVFFFATYWLYRILINSVFISLKESYSNSSILKSNRRLKISKFLIKLPIYYGLFYCFIETLRIRNSLFIAENRKKPIEIINTLRGIRNHKKFAYNFNTGKLLAFHYKE